MRKFIILFIVLQAFSANAQITLEHSISNSTGNVDLIRINTNEYRYIKIAAPTNGFTIYDLNLSVQQTGVFPFNLTGNSNKGIPQYFSTELFDCDSTNIEYIVNVKNCPFVPCYGHKVLIYRLDGTLLFQKDSFMLQTTEGGVNPRDNYIRSTNQGTKLIMLKENYDSTLIYNLCGALPEPLAMEEENHMFFSKVYPNPGTNYFLFEFPVEDFTSGFVRVFDSEGKMVQEYKVDNTFGKLYVSTMDYIAGNYIISLFDENDELRSSKKVIVAK